MNGDLVPAEHALRRARHRAGRLAAKEGLALINGTQLMTALGVVLVHEARNVLDVADIAGASPWKRFAARTAPLTPEFRKFVLTPARSRPPHGCGCSPREAKSWVPIGKTPTACRTHTHCAACLRFTERRAMRSRYVAGVMETEINSVTDNPLIFGPDDVISCGNFHGQPLALALDFAAIALAELASVSERRIEAMLDPHLSELPPFLTMRGGVDSGLMVSQYTAAALVSENKVLAHPASVDSIPTSANQEDHVSMGVTAGLKAGEILRNVQTVLAIELLCGAAGLEYRRPLRTSAPLEAVHALIRSEVPPLESDRVLYPDMQRVIAMVRDGRIGECVRES